MNGQMITFAGNGATYQGYLSSPKSGPGPGVIVIQEWWGLVGHIKDVADRFAAEGFNALAPDFYLGQVAEEPEEAGKLMMALNIAETEKILRGAVDRLLADPMTRGDRVGVVGFCMGGQLALYAATVNPKIGACVDFYGIHPNVEPDLSALSGPFLGIFAELDTYTPPETVKALREQLEALGKKVETVTYPNTHHAFFNDDRPEVYNAEAARDAWERTVRLFRESL